MSSKNLTTLATVVIAAAGLTAAFFLISPNADHSQLAPENPMKLGLSANHEIRNSYGEGIALACQHGRPTVVLIFDSRLRTRNGEYIFVDIDDRRRDNERSKNKDLKVYVPVISNGEDGNGVILRAEHQGAAKLVKFVSESAKLHFSIDEKYGFLVNSEFQLTRDDQLGAEKVLQSCPVKMPKPGILTQ